MNAAETNISETSVTVKTNQGSEFTQWQPIDFAPKDGSEILGYREDAGVLLIRWGCADDLLTDDERDKLKLTDDEQFSPSWFYADFISGGRLDGDEAPTHWMPLPTLPTLAREEFTVQFTEIDLARFWSKVDKNGEVPAHMPHLGKCWNWTCGTRGGGYGRFKMKRIYHVAHRLSYILRFGSIPIRLSALHKCDNKLCVNPDHLWAGTQKENIMDAAKKKRMCFQAHPEKIKRGEDANSSKLTAEQVLEIRRRYVPTIVTMAQLAELFGVGQTTVECIINRTTWNHLPPEQPGAAH